MISKRGRPKQDGDNGRPQELESARDSASAVVVITLQDLERAMISRILAILRSLEISAKAVPSGREVDDARRLGFRIPRDRVAEVVLALGNQGFRNLRVYEGSADARQRSG